LLRIYQKYVIIMQYLNVCLLEKGQLAHHRLSCIHGCSGVPGGLEERAQGEDWDEIGSNSPS
jgi:hypothetical protein